MNWGFWLRRSNALRFVRGDGFGVVSGLLFALAGFLAFAFQGLYTFLAFAYACGQRRGEDEFDLFRDWNFFGDEESAGGLDPCAGIVDVGVDADGLDGRDGVHRGV